MLGGRQLPCSLVRLPPLTSPQASTKAGLSSDRYRYRTAGSAIQVSKSRTISPRNTISNSCPAAARKFISQSLISAVLVGSSLSTLAFILYTSRCATAEATVGTTSVAITKIERCCKHTGPPADRTPPVRSVHRHAQPPPFGHNQASQLWVSRRVHTCLMGPVIRSQYGRSRNGPWLTRSTEACHC